MAAVTFDTFKFVKTLTQSGMPEGQAAAISNAVGAVHATADLATKADLHAVETAIRSDMEKMEITLRHDMEKMEQRMIIKLGSLLVIAVGVLVAMEKIFP